jgi:RNase P subunit RPR2
MSLTDFFCEKCGKPFDIADFIYILFDHGEYFSFCKKCQEALYKGKG